MEIIDLSCINDPKSLVLSATQAKNQIFHSTKFWNNLPHDCESGLISIEAKSTKKSFEIKFIFLEKSSKIYTEDVFYPLASFLPSTVHFISALYIDKASPISRNTCLTIKNNISSLQQDNSSKILFILMLRIHDPPLCTCWCGVLNCW